jgi:hypothetical protein
VRAVHLTACLSMQSACCCVAHCGVNDRDPCRQKLGLFKAGNHSQSHGHLQAMPVALCAGPFASAAFVASFKKSHGHEPTFSIAVLFRVYCNMGAWERTHPWLATPQSSSCQLPVRNPAAPPSCLGLTDFTQGCCTACASMQCCHLAGRSHSLGTKKLNSCQACNTVAGASPCVQKQYSTRTPPQDANTH